jgi:hypothetical protein
MGTTPNLVRPLLQVNTIDGGTVQQDGQIVGLNDGGYVIVYDDQSPAFTIGQAVVGQRFDAAGNKVGGELRVGAFDDGQDSVANGSSITNLHNGNIAFAYTDVFNGHSDVWVRVLNPALGVVRDDAIDTGTGHAKNASITSFANGSYAVSYTLDIGGGDTDVAARIVSATGVVGAPITLGDNGMHHADFSQLATLSNNTVVDVYQRLAGADHDIYFSIYTSSGAPVVLARVVSGADNVFEQTDPDVAALTGGGFVVAWTADAHSVVGLDVGMAIYDNAGNLVSWGKRIDATGVGAQSKVSLVALQDGGFVATWEDDGYGTLRGQRFDAIGHQIGEEFIVRDFGNSTSHPVDSTDTALLSDGRFAYAHGDIIAADLDVYTSIWSPKTPHDFGADGHSDILWRDPDTGQNAIWSMDGGKMVGHADLMDIPASWHIADTGDFNADGRADILWRSDTGDNAIWLMNGGAMVGHADLAPMGALWIVADVADFSGEGKADILWRNPATGQNTIWFMDGGTKVGQADLAGIPAPWIIADAADFNGDGKADILWRDPDTGQNAIWFMNGGNKVGHSDLTGVAAPWRIADTGDFNGDGKADILWRDPDTGQNVIWFMDGGAKIGHADLQGIPAPWDIVETADYNGDGKADILWRDPATGQNAVWFMDGGNIIGNTDLPTIGAPWHIVHDGALI